MKLIFGRTAAAIACLSTLILTACSDAPSKDDCASALNLRLEKHDAVLSMPGRYVKEYKAFILKLPESLISDYPQIKISAPEDHELNADMFLNNDSGIARARKQIDIVKELEKTGYAKIEYGIYEELVWGRKGRYAGIRITPDDKMLKLIKSDLINGITFKIGSFTADEITEIAPKPELIGGFEYYNFKYTKKIVNLTEGFDPEFIELLKEEIYNDSKVNPHQKKAKAAKIDGVWKCQDADFFWGI